MSNRLPLLDEFRTLDWKKIKREVEGFIIFESYRKLGPIRLVCHKTIKLAFCKVLVYYLNTARLPNEHRLVGRKSIFVYCSKSYN